MELNEKQFHVRNLFWGQTQKTVLCSVHYLKVRKVPKLNIVTHKNDLPYSE